MGRRLVAETTDLEEAAPATAQCGRRRRTPYPPPFPTPSPTGILGHKTCKHTYCTYKNGVTDIYSMGNNNGLATPATRSSTARSSAPAASASAILPAAPPAAPFATTTLPATRRLSSTAKPSRELYVKCPSN